MPDELKHQTEIAVLTVKLETQAYTLQRIEAKLDSVTGDHEKRLRELESSDRKWAGGAVALSAVLSVVLKLLWP